MIRGFNLQSAAPAIAVVVIIVVFVVAKFWYLPSRKAAIPAAPAPAAPTAEPIPSSGPQETIAAATWSTYHGGTDLSGYTDQTFPDKPDILWQHLVDGAIQQPVVADEKGLYVATTSGSVVSLDFGGQPRWSKSLVRTSKSDGAQLPERIEAPIACFRGTVLAPSLAGLVHALSTDTGEERWTYAVGGELLGTVNLHTPSGVGDPSLFAIQRDDGTLHRFSLADGAPLWRSDAISRCDGSPAILGDVLVYGSCASALHVYAPGENRVARSVSLGEDCQVASGPALVGNLVYSGSRAGHVVCANVQTGEVVWTNLDSKQEVFTTPAVAPHHVVFGSEDGAVYGLDRGSGRTKWRYETGSKPTSALIAANKVIVAAGGVLRFLQLDNGEETWRHEISDHIAAPSLIRGMIVVGSEDGTVMAFGAKPS